MSKKPKPVWIDCGNGRKRLVIGAEAERIRKLARHTNKTLYSVSVHPDQIKDFQAEAVQAGFTNIRFTPDGKCHADSRKAQQEYVYYRTGYVNNDGGYYETIPESRKRELDRLARRS